MGFPIAAPAVQPRQTTGLPNDILRALTAFSVIILPLTLIASL
jgi:Mg2+ and Co2+ transporter CorA